MRIKVIEVREGAFDLDPADYPEGSTIDDCIAIERENAGKFIEYMDWLDADSTISFTVIEE